MKRIVFLIFIILLAEIPIPVSVSASGIFDLPADREIDWSRAGVWVGAVKGIPNYPVGVICSYPTYAVDPTGVTDSAAGINAAIKACPSGYAVLLPAGTYRTDSAIVLKSGVVLRGAGIGSTRIVSRSTGDAIRMAGTGSGSYPDTDIISGYTKGSDTIVVTSAASFAVGDLVIVDQLNDPAITTISGGEGTCSWCSRDSGARAFGESLRITNIAGTTITLNRPLYYTYNGAYTPQLCLAAHSPIINAGIEDLYITAYSATQTQCIGIHVYFAYGCWMKNLEIEAIPRKFIWIQGYSQGCEIRDSYFHEGTQFDGDHGYGVSITDQSSDNLIENNTFARTHVIVAFGSAGGAGNVVGYNYGHNTIHHTINWFLHSFATHGAHTYMNLWEGNVIPKMGFDHTWGSGSHQLAFRNHIRGNNPDVAVTTNLSAIVIAPDNRYNTFICNVLGHSGYTGTYTYVDAGHYSIWEISADASPNTIRHGNYDYVDDEIKWDGEYGQDNIPDSLYLASKPSWFGSLAWPPFTPERLGFNAANLNKIPAQVRYEGGTPPPSDTTPPSPPTGVTVN